MRKLLEEIHVGTRTIAGTEWPIYDQLHRTGEREWTVTRELCNGVPRSSETYRSESAAREAFDRRLVGRKPRADQTASETVKLRATRDERRAWERAASARDMTLSEWIRERCDTHAVRFTVERDSDGTIAWWAYNANGGVVGWAEIELGPLLDVRVLKAAGEHGVVFEDSVAVEDLT